MAIKAWYARGGGRRNRYDISNNYWLSMQEGAGETGMISEILAQYTGGGRVNRYDISNTGSGCRRGRGKQVSGIVPVIMVKYA